MEHYIFYCKLSLLAVLSLITACCMLSRRWYVNLAAFLACLSGETFLAHLFFPGYMLCPAAASFIILFLSRIWDLSRTPAKGNGADPIRLPVRSGIRESRLEFHYHYSNFLVYGGAGSGKTKSIGKWLLSEYMRLGFAGFIYDFKDTDYTRTAYNLIKRHRYPHKFYYVSFDRPERSYRFNPLKVVRDRTELIQLMEDMILALLPKKEQHYECVAGGESSLVSNACMEEMRVRGVKLTHRIPPRFPFHLAFRIYDYSCLSSNSHCHRVETAHMREIVISENQTPKHFPQRHPRRSLSSYSSRQP